MSKFPSRIASISLALCKTWLKKAPNAHRPARKILIAHNLLLGDTLLLAPLMANLARLYPDAERIILAKPAFTALFSGHPYGFQAHAYDPRRFSTFRALLKTGPYDLAFVLGDNRYAWLARALGARWIIGFEGDKPAWKNWMIDDPKPHPATPTAWADMAAALASQQRPPNFSPSDWPAPTAHTFDLPTTPFAILHVGASSAVKHWPKARWQRLAEKLATEGITPVWSAGPGEEHLVDAIDPAKQFQRYAGSLSLAQIWHLLAAAKLLVSPDTGIAHLAKIVGTPTVALFGPGSASIYGKGEFWSEAQYEAITDTPFPCRNQHTLFRREIRWVQRCGRNTEKCARASSGIKTSSDASPCMSAIAFDTVWATCETLLGHLKARKTTDHVAPKATNDNDDNE